jgi:hypothetical protein
MITGPPTYASKLLNDSPANCFNDLILYQLRDETLSQVVPKIYDPSNFFDDVSHENKTPQVQVRGAQIPKDHKVHLLQAVNLPPQQPCVCAPPSLDSTFSQEAPVMEWDSPLRTNDCWIYKARTPIVKGMKLRPSLLVKPPSSVSPARRKNRHIAASRTKAVLIPAKYNPICAMQSKREVMKRRSQLSLEYKVHQLNSLGIPLSGKLGGAPNGLGDVLLVVLCRASPPMTSSSRAMNVAASTCICRMLRTRPYKSVNSLLLHLQHVSPSVDAAVRRTAELRRGARMSLQHSSFKSTTRYHVCQQTWSTTTRSEGCVWMCEVQVTTMTVPYRATSF